MSTSEQNIKTTLCEHNCSITTLEAGLCLCYNNALNEKYQPKVEETFNCAGCGKSFSKLELTPCTDGRVYCENCLTLLTDE